MDLHCHRHLYGPPQSKAAAAQNTGAQPKQVVDLSVDECHENDDEAAFKEVSPMGWKRSGTAPSSPRSLIPGVLGGRTDEGLPRPRHTSPAAATRARTA